MSYTWIRCKLTAELLSDTHPGSGAGGGGIDALIARDRHDRPVIWASHIEGVLRDAARRLKGDAEAEAFFGRAGGHRQRAIFTSLYVQGSPESRIWRSTARQAFDNRAPKDDTLRAIEYVPKGTQFAGEVELPEEQYATLERLIWEVDALGSGRATGSGRVKLSLEKIAVNCNWQAENIKKERLLLLLRNRDPLCITATATPTNVIPSFAFVPGRALLGALANWLIEEGDRHTASLLTSGGILVSDALPLPECPNNLASVEVLPAPLSLQSRKPTGSASEVPWWAEPVTPTQRLDAWTAQTQEKLKRPEDDLFVYRPSADVAWTTFRPERRVRLRNGRPDPKQPEPSLFAIEQIVEKTCFLAELRGSLADMRTLVDKLAPVLGGARWLRVGRGGAPVEVVGFVFSDAGSAVQVQNEALLILTSDLLVRDDYLRWRTALDETTLRSLVGDQIQLERTLQESVAIHGFNGTSRLWRMPAAAIRRGSIFKVSGPGVQQLAQRAAQGQWLGERTHEGFGRFRLEMMLPGVTDGQPAQREVVARPDDPEEAIAKETKGWFEAHRTLAHPDGERQPSLSQWMDLLSDLERGQIDAIERRLQPTTAGAKSWKQEDAREILNKLNRLKPEQRAAYARYFVRWLRAEMRANRDKKQEVLCCKVP